MPSPAWRRAGRTPRASRRSRRLERRLQRRFEILLEILCAEAAQSSRAGCRRAVVREIVDESGIRSRHQFKARQRLHRHCLGARHPPATTIPTSTRWREDRVAPAGREPALARALGFLHAELPTHSGEAILNTSEKLGICWFTGRPVRSGARREGGFMALLREQLRVPWIQLERRRAHRRAPASTGSTRSGIYAGGNVTSVKTGRGVRHLRGLHAPAGDLFALDFGGSTATTTRTTLPSTASSRASCTSGGQAGPVGWHLSRAIAPFGDRTGTAKPTRGCRSGPVTVELHYGLSDYGGDGSDDEYVELRRSLARTGLAGARRHITKATKIAKFVAAISRSWTVGR